MITALSAAVQGAVGFGFAVLSVPVLSLVNPALAPVPQLLVTLPMTLAMAWRERSHLHLKGVGWVLAGRLPGAALGILLLKSFDERVLDVVIALMVLGSVAILASGVHLRSTPTTQFGAGVASGTAGLVASIGGPPVALLYRNHSGPAIRANLAVIFTFGILISVGGRALAGEMTGSDVRVALVMLPALAVGLLASGRMLSRVEGRFLRTAILTLSAIAAAGLLARAALA